MVRTNFSYDKLVDFECTCCKYKYAYIYDMIEIVKVSGDECK